MTKFFAEMGTIAKRNMRTISRYSHISTHDREKEIKDRKKQDKNISFFTKMAQNRRKTDVLTNCQNCIK